MCLLTVLCERAHTSIHIQTYIPPFLDCEHLGALCDGPLHALSPSTCLRGRVDGNALQFTTERSSATEKGSGSLVDDGYLPRCFPSIERCRNCVLSEVGDAETNARRQMYDYDDQAILIQGRRPNCSLPCCVGL